MNQPIPVPPQHMPGGQRMMPQGQQGQQRPPPQFPQQGQFPAPQFQQPPQFHQRLPIVTDDRFNADQPINGVARIHNIVPIKQKTEKDYRKELTTYAAYTISPSKDDTVKDKKDKDKRSSSTKTVDKGTWTRALIIEQFFAQDDIAKTVKKLDERESVTKKMKDLGPNQSTQVSNILDSKLMSDRDPQFEWVVAQLDKAFNVDKHGKKTTKSITVYLRRAPKAGVDCMEILRRREQRKFEQQQQQQQHLEHQRNVQAMQRQQEMQQIQHQMPQMGRGMGPGPMGPGPMGPGRMGPPPMAGRGRGEGGGGGPPAGIRVVQSDSSSDSSSNSGSDSESDSEVSSATSHSISTRPSRSGRHGRRDKQYYGRGTSRNRSRSRNRNSREKDYLVVEPPRRRLESGRGTPGRGVHYVPDSPRSPRGSSRPGFPRSSTYNGRPSVRVQTSRESQEDFFSMDQHSPRMQPRPILHQTRPDATNIDMLAAAMQAGVQAGIRASKEESVATQALTVQRPVTLHRDPLTMPRPPIPHSVSDFQDRRPRGRDLDDIVARAEALQLQDDLARYRDQALRDSRSPPRGLPRDLDRVPRRFAGADMFDPYRSIPMSPSISSGSSGFSHSSRGGRDPYSSRDHEYEHRRRAPSVFDSDREEYDFVGRDEANPFRPLHYRRASSRSRPPPLRRDSFRSEIPFSRGGY